MGRALLISCMLICCAASADALTYQWTDDQGVIGFTDNINNVPAKYRSRARTREDITTRNPRVRQELWQQEQRLRREEQSAPGGAILPEEELPPPPPDPRVGPGRESADDTLPPGRTKSQRIRDNIERRQLEDH